LRAREPALALQRDYQVAAEALQGRRSRKQEVVAPIQPSDESAGRKDTAGHREELIATGFNVREGFPELAQLPPAERFFIRGASLGGIWQSAARPPQNWIAAPRFAEDGDASGSQDAPQFLSSDAQIEVVQDGVAPDAVEGFIGEWQPLAVGLHEGNGDAIGIGSAPRFGEVAPRQIESRDARAAPGQYDGRHGVAAAVIQNAQPGHFTEPVEGGSYPGLVIEIGVVVKLEFVWADVESRSALAGLIIMESPFGG
jgi:hypothetical protein